jgi:UDP-galactopyranose mutase
MGFQMDQLSAASVARNSTIRAASRTAFTYKPPLICFSHLRWGFVFQRPQHLMTRAARDRQVFYWEEPLFAEPARGGRASLDVCLTPCGVTVLTPLLAHGTDQQSAIRAQRLLLDRVLLQQRIQENVFWYYTPQSLPFSSHVLSSTLVYDCMDELSAFLGADAALPMLERDLLARASVVFTGGFSLYEVKRQQHHNAHPLPSGVDVAHFHPARQRLPEPADQQMIPHPRLGFYGVIDERLDVALLSELASRRPNWQFVLIGPIAKIDPATLPHAANIHYLGGKPYNELPAYLSGWDVALMPFARNDATRFISPTKTPEYLAAGRPVVSTPIVDVERHYGHVKAVWIAATPSAFAAAIEEALLFANKPERWQDEVDNLLAAASWDSIWQRMTTLIDQVADPAVARSDLLPARSA